MATPEKVASYPLTRLRSNDLEHIFGVHGEIALSFMQQISARGIALLNTCDEQGAGIAVDVYARIKALAAGCVTCGVGGLELADTPAQAYAERSLVVVLSGAPATVERRMHLLVHRRMRPFDSQRKVFEARLLNYGKRLIVRTDEDSERALKEARSSSDKLFLVEVRLDRLDASATLKRLASDFNRASGEQAGG